MYLGLITDKWSRKIVGFHLGETLERQYARKPWQWPSKASREASDRFTTPTGGAQYCPHACVKQVGLAGLSMSMTEKNHSAENALAERVNGILKQEYWLEGI